MAAANKVMMDDFEDTSQALQHVHERILQELVNIADSLPDLTGTPALRVEFVDPNGSVHDTPFWARDPQED